MPWVALDGYELVVGKAARFNSATVVNAVGKAVMMNLAALDGYRFNSATVVNAVGTTWRP